MTPGAARQQKPRSLARTAALLLPVQLTFRAGEAALPVLLAVWFGRSEVTDVFFLFSVYYTFAGSLVSGGFQDSVLVPIVTDVRRSDPAGVGAVASSLFGHVLLVACALAAVLGAVALGWAHARLPHAMFATAAVLSLWFGLHLVAVGVRSLLVALLNSHGSYFVHPVATGSGFGLALASIAAGRHAHGVAAIPMGLLAGEILAIAVLGSFAKIFIGLPLRPSLARPEPVRRFLRLVVSDVAGATITRINPVIDQVVAATAGVIGGGTILRYTMEVSAIPTTLLQATVLPVLLGRLSWQAAEKSPRTLEKTIRSTLVTTAALMAFLAGILVLTRKTALRAVFLHGHMDAVAVDTMAAVLPWAVVGSIPFGALLVLARAHVALQNTRFMLPLGVMNATMNLVFDLAFVRIGGLAGIAFATSLVHAIIAVVFWRALRLHIRRTTFHRRPSVAS